MTTKKKTTPKVEKVEKVENPEALQKENETAPEVKAETEPDQEPKQSVSNPVDKSTYDKFTSLKFLSFSETKLTDETKKELAELEAELKLCSGFKPKMTRRAAIGNEQVLLVEGVTLPEEYYNIILSDKHKDFYLK